VQLVVPVARFLLEQRLKLADAGLAKVEDIHGGAGRSFMIADSARRARKVALYRNAWWLLLHATQAEQLRKGQQKARATMAKDFE
jgi:hypothetical protein